MALSSLSMHRRFFFMQPKWIGTGKMITGAGGAIYSLATIIKYAFTGGPVTPFIGVTPMAFSTAVILFSFGLAIFWGGFLDRDLKCDRPQGWTRKPLQPQHIVQIILALISAMSVIAVALIAALKG